MTNVNNSAGKASRASYTPPEPPAVHCGFCKFVARKGAYKGRDGDPACRHCGTAYPKPELHSVEDSENWITQNKRDRRAYERWKHWQELGALKVVPPSHARYSAWMALRCHLLEQGGGLRRAASNQIAHIAAVIILGVERRENSWWFGELLMDENLSGALYSPEHDDEDHGMADALLTLWTLLVDPVGSRDDILPGDHAVIVGALQ